MLKARSIWVLLLIGILLVQRGLAQNDSVFYEKYPSMLAFGIYEEVRNNALAFERTGVATSDGPHTVKYNTNGQQVTGLIINYDKIYIAFGIKTTNEEVVKKGKSNNTNFALKLHGNKLLIEATYRNYRGFYDEHTPLYFSDFKDTTPYYRDESMRNRTIKLKGFYFTNHKKFSYNAAYFGSYRQMKSAASWVLNANFYVKKIYADSSLIPFYAREVFSPYSYVKGIDVTGFSLGGGATANLVAFKRFFFNAMFTLGIEPQWRTYEIVNNTEIKQSFVSAMLDFRSSLGYNSKRFFVLITSYNDVSFNNSETLTFTDNFLSGAFIIGYRFPFENGATHALKANKIYRAL